MQTNYETVTSKNSCCQNDLNTNTTLLLSLELVIRFVLKLSYYKYCWKHKPHLKIPIRLKEYLQTDILYSHKTSKTIQKTLWQVVFRKKKWAGYNEAKFFFKLKCKWWRIDNNNNHKTNKQINKKKRLMNNSQKKNNDHY